MTSEELEELAQRRLQDLVTAHPLGYNPSLEWRRLRVTAGLADFRRGAVILSRVLITDPDRLESTLLHEYAHLLAFARHGRRGTGHGAAWRSAMVELGQTPQVTHRYPVERNVPRQAVAYRCAACGAEFVRRRKLSRKFIYRHVGCGGRLIHAWTKRITPTAGNS